MALIDLATDIKPWLSIDQTDTKHDNTLNVINEAMSQAVINFVEHDFSLKTVEEYQDGNQSDVILTNNIPINSVSAIYFWTNTDGSDGSLIDPSHYQVRDTEIVLRDYPTPFSRARLRIDYVWGYDGLPADVKLMLLQAVEAEFRRKGNKTLGGFNRSKKDESMSTLSDNDSWDKKTGLPSVLVYKLESYKVFEFPRQPMAIRNY